MWRHVELPFSIQVIELRRAGAFIQVTRDMDLHFLFSHIVPAAGDDSITANGSVLIPPLSLPPKTPVILVGSGKDPRRGNSRVAFAS